MTKPELETKINIWKLAAAEDVHSKFSPTVIELITMLREALRVLDEKDHGLRAALDGIERIMPMWWSIQETDYARNTLTIQPNFLSDESAEVTK